MSKSLGNFITINELKNNYNGQVIRLAMLSTIILNRLTGIKIFWKIPEKFREMVRILFG